MQSSINNKDTAKRMMMMTNPAQQQQINQWKGSEQKIQYTLATKHHNSSNTVIDNDDTNNAKEQQLYNLQIFLDIDMAVLGK